MWNTECRIQKGHVETDALSCFNCMAMQGFKVLLSCLRLGSDVLFNHIAEWFMYHHLQYAAFDQITFLNAFIK